MTSRKPLKVMLIAPRKPATLALATSLDSDPRFLTEANFTSLGEAYSPTESTPPDLVICAKSIAANDEFPMYNALIDLLGVRLIVVPDDADAATIARLLGLRPPEATSPKPPTTNLQANTKKIIAIGASTGGIEALSRILSKFPANCPPTIVVQHIKPEFLNGVVARLDRVSPATVRAASHRHRLEPGLVLFAPGLPQHLEIDPQSRVCKLRDGPPTSGHRPSVDRMFQSLVPVARDVVGVLLTGMGRDGATGLGALRRGGARTLAQDAESSTVYGMPRVAFQEGAVCDVVSIDDMAPAIIRATKRQKEMLL